MSTPGQFMADIPDWWVFTIDILMIARLPHMGAFSRPLTQVNATDIYSSKRQIARSRSRVYQDYYESLSP